MKVRKAFVFPTLVLASLSTIFCQQAFSAVRGYTILSGSGPVFSSPLKPGERTVEVVINNDNNLNVGYDLIEQGTGNVIANGTIKDRGGVRKNATAHKGRTYNLRLRCQEPSWNDTKCNAQGSVNW